MYRSGSESDSDDSDYLSVKSSQSNSTDSHESSTSSKKSVSSESSSDAEEEDGSIDDGGDLDEEELDFLIDLEAKILAMRRESATAASREDAAFIENKIKEMEEFIREAKTELGIPFDADMTLETANKKRGRGKNGTGAIVEDDSDDDIEDNDAEPAVKRKHKVVAA